MYQAGVVVYFVVGCHCSYTVYQLHSAATAAAAVM